MAWVKLDDGFFRHPKALAAGKDGRALFLAGICWSSANLTDGHIPGAALRTVCADAEVKMTVAAVLVAAGLWEHADDGFRIHDFTVFQRSAETVKRDREAGRERAKKSKASREAQPQKRRSFDRSHTAASAALRPIEVEVDTSKPSSSVVDLETPVVAREADDNGDDDFDIDAGQPPQPTDTDARVATALGLLVDQAEQAKRARGETINNPPGYRRHVADDKRSEHSATLTRLAVEHPDWTPAALAALVAAPQDPTCTEGRPQPPMIEHQPWCPECEHEHSPWTDHWTPPTDGTAGLTPGTPEFIEARRAHRLAQGATRQNLMSDRPPAGPQ